MTEEQNQPFTEERRPSAEEQFDIPSASPSPNPEEPPTGAESASAEETPDQGGPSSPEASDTRIKELESEVASLKERYLRAVADLDNYRRRALREKEELRTVAIAHFVEKLLTPLDNFSLGLQDAAQREETAPLVTGFKMVFDQLERALEDSGIEKLNPAPGTIFDPQNHHCMAHQPNPDHEEGLITTTARVGYRLKERLIRPASVLVSSGSPDSINPAEASATTASDSSSQVEA
ncbi:MAG: nucleotide exchange factor GrpE [Puniceicoccaceae bacterium]